MSVKAKIPSTEPLAPRAKVCLNTALDRVLVCLTFKVVSLVPFPAVSKVSARAAFPGGLPKELLLEASVASQPFSESDSDHSSEWHPNLLWHLAHVRNRSRLRVRGQRVLYLLDSPRTRQASFQVGVA